MELLNRYKKVITLKVLQKYARFKGVEKDLGPVKKREDIITRLKELLGEDFEKDMKNILDYYESIDSKALKRLLPSFVKDFDVNKPKIDIILELYFAEGGLDVLELLKSASDYARTGTELIFKIPEHIGEDKLNELVNQIIKKLEEKFRESAGIDAKIEVNHHRYEDKDVILVRFDKRLVHVDEIPGPPPRKGPHKDIPAARAYIEVSGHEKRVVCRAPWNIKKASFIRESIVESFSAVDTKEKVKEYVVDKGKLVKFLLASPSDLKVTSLVLRGELGVVGLDSLALKGDDVICALKRMSVALRDAGVLSEDLLREDTLSGTIEFLVMVDEKRKKRASLRIQKDGVVLVEGAGRRELLERLLREGVVHER